MSVKWERLGMTVVAGLLAVGTASATHAQGMQGSSQQTPGAQQPPGQTPSQPGQTPADASKGGMALDVAPPVNAEEDAAFKAFEGTPEADSNKKIDLGEAFAQKYPSSRYLPVIYANLTMLYLKTNQVEKMEAVGDKAVKLTPTDVQTMAILAQTIPRAMNSTTSGAEQQKELAKAEDYSKRAI